MKNLATEIMIHAPAEKVWQVLMDHSRYPEWNPFIKSIRGNVAVGRKINVVLQLERGKPMEMQPKVLKKDTNKEFRWLGHDRRKNESRF